MKAKLLLLSIAILFSVNTFSQVTFTIVPNLDFATPATAVSGLDATGLTSAIDRVTGHIYQVGWITVSGQKDLYVVEFDSTGAQVNQAQYDYSGNADKGLSICVTTSSVFVCGSSEATSGNADVITIAYDLNLNQLWAQRIAGTAGTNDQGNSIVSDGSSVYVGGYVNQTGKGKDYTIFKYNSTGSLTASVKKNGNNLDDICEKIVYSGGNIYSTGSLHQSGSNNDVLTMCIATSGTMSVTWSVTANGTASGGNDTGKDIKLDGSNILICGSLNNSGTSDDYYFSVLTASTGAVTYTNTADAYGGSDVANSLVCDKIGDYAITGNAMNGSFVTIWTQGFTASSFLWNNFQPTNGSFSTSLPKVNCDTIAKYFYTCYTYSNSVTGNLDAYLNQIDPSGVKKWEKLYDGGNGRDIHTDMILDGYARIYLSTLAETSTTNVYQIKCLRYSQTPVYNVPDPLSEPTNAAYAYTQNNGQLITKDISFVDSVVCDIPFYTEHTIPNFFIRQNSFSFIFSRVDTVVSTLDSISKVNVSFGENSNSLTDITTLDQLAGTSNYFIPMQPNGVTNVPSFARLMIPNIYPGIDLHYYSNAAGIKFYWVVKPFVGNPGSISCQFTGAVTSTSISGTDLLINTDCGTLKLEQGYAYQVDTSLTVTTMTWAATWNSLGADKYNFNIGTYNPLLPLVIEVDQGNIPYVAGAPYNRLWQTYFGGNQSDRLADMRTDSLGNIYSLNNTNSYTFYSAPSVLTILASSSTPANEVLKFDKIGKSLKRTYIQYGGATQKRQMTVLPDLSVILVGSGANNIPPPHGGTNPSGSYTNSTGNSYVLRLSPTLDTVKWSTRYPGYLYDVDNFQNNIYVVGTADKTGTNAAYLLSETGALNLGTSNITGSSCGVISKFTGTGSPLWSSFIPVLPLAGSADNIMSIRINKTYGEFYIFGSVQDTIDFLHYNAYGGPSYNQLHKRYVYDGFIQKYRSDDSVLVSTYYGGNDAEYLEDAVILSNRNVCFVGQTNSTDLSNITFNPMDGSWFHAAAAQAVYDPQGWISKFDTRMVRTWAITYGDSMKSTIFYTVCADPLDNIFALGSTGGMNGYNLLTGFYTQATSTTVDAAIVHFNSLNQRRWITPYGDPANSDGGSFCSAYNPLTNELVWGGETSAPSAWPTVQYLTAYWQPTNNSSSTGYPDGFIGRFDLSKLSGVHDLAAKKDSASNVILFPNPTSDVTHLLFKNDIHGQVKITVYNAVGQTVESRTALHIEKYEIMDFNFVYLHNGMYFVNISSSSANETLKFVKTR